MTHPSSSVGEEMRDSERDTVPAWYAGLSRDLTNCLSQRNAELLEARHVIGALLVALAVPAADKEKPVSQGREWLKKYNDRVYPKQEAVNE